MSPRLVVRLSSKGQMTLPIELRRRLNLKEGDRLAVMVDGDDLRIKKVEKVSPLSPEDPIWELIGSGESGCSDVSSRHDDYLAEGEAKRWKPL